MLQRQTMKVASLWQHRLLAVSGRSELPALRRGASWQAPLMLRGGMPTLSAQIRSFCSKSEDPDSDAAVSEAVEEEDLDNDSQDPKQSSSHASPNIVDIINTDMDTEADGEEGQNGMVLSKKGQSSDGRPRFVKLPNVFAMGLSGRPLMPGQVAFMHIEDSQMEQYLLALCKADIPYIGIFRSKRPENEEAPDIASSSGGGGGLKDILDTSDDGQDGPEDKDRASRKARDRQQRQRRIATQRMVKEVLGGSGVEDYMSQLFLALPNPTSNTIVRNADEIHEHGVYASIQRISKGEGGLQLIIKGESRIRVTGVMATKPALVVKVEHISEEPQPLSVLAAERVKNSEDPKADEEEWQQEQERQDRIKAYTMEICSLFKALSTKNHMYKHIWSLLTMDQNFVTNPSKLADYVTTYTHASGDDLQEILETNDVEERLKKTLSLLKKQQSLLDVQMEIRQEVESKIEESQRRHLLNQQLSYIKKELGIEKDDKQVLIDSFRERLKSRHPDEKVLTVINEEIDRLSSLDASSSEFSTIRNYLDWLTIMPWGVYTKENYSIKHARKVLAEDHYGMDDVKDTILQFIAMGKLRGGDVPQGKILCLVGPPGVGKTSIGKSIARALNRKFYRFSVGGMNDVTEIKGHRRTYVGAMPGKFVQCLKRTQSSNCLILIDEIDKMGMHRMGGDPSAALLEALDPEQNNTFMDHYLDVPVDLSKVMFLCTSNSMEIPEALRDRMEFVELSGYDLVEKMHIARDYLIPKEMERSGLKSGEVELTDEALHALIQGYCRESGVRSLDKHIQKVYRKVALEKVELLEEDEPEPSEASDNPATAAAVEQEEVKLAEAIVAELAQPVTAEAVPAAEATPAEEEQPVELLVSVTADNLEKYVGIPVFESDRYFDITPPGVVMGLAWTKMGGSTIYIETIAEHVNGPQMSSRVQTPLDDGEKKPTAGQGSLQLTGSMGDVMKESAWISYSVAKRMLERISPGNRYFSEHKIHLHVPEGAISKDGPSAGVTMTTALLSLALQREVLPNLSMTGEITLTGQVLKVGGIKEKLLAARRSGSKVVTLPASCKKDVKELKDHLKEGLEIHFTHTYDDVLRIAFPGIEVSVPGADAGAAEVASKQ